MKLSFQQHNLSRFQKLMHRCKRCARSLVQLWDNFIPSDRNGHKPHALRHRVLVGYSVCLILLKALVIIVPIALPSSSLYSSAITSQNIIDLTNQTRRNLDLPELKENERLMGAAQAKADDMLLQQYFAHVSPAGRTPWSWITGAGYRYAYAGENLAVHFASSEGVQEGWMASPSHRANIVHPKYEEMGIGITHGTFDGYETTIVVEMFGTPASQVAVTKPAPTLAPTPEPATPTPAPTPAVSGETSALAPTPVTPTVSVPSPEPIKAIAVTPQQVQAETTLPTTAPVMYDTSLKVSQKAADYDVKLMVTGATSVLARYGGTSVNLYAESAVPPHGVERGAEWRGTVPFDVNQISRGGDLLTATAIGRDGTVVEHPLAWLAPSIPTQQMYTFNEGSDKFAKFFGFLTVHNLNDTVSQFYLYFVIFLVAALLLNIFIKIRVQHTSIISHTMLVIALALLLSVV